MEQKQIEDAIKNVFSDKKFVESFAKDVSKEIIKQKATPSNDEEGLVKAHVLFSEEGSETGTFMTTKEIMEEIHAFKDVNIRPRIFGKALMADAKVTKETNAGRVYLIEAVLEEISEESVKNLINFDVNFEEVKDAPETEETGEALTSEDLDDMELSELLDVLKAAPFKIKKAKKMDADELRERLKAEFGLVGAEEEETQQVEEDSLSELIDMNKKGLKEFIKNNNLDISTKNKDEDEIVSEIRKALSKKESKEEPNDKQQKEVDQTLLIAAINGHETVDDYEDFLDDMKAKEVVKHVEKYKIPVDTSLEKEDLIEAIIDVIVKALGEKETESKEKDSKNHDSSKDNKDSKKIKVKNKKEKKSKKKKDKNK